MKVYEGKSVFNGIAIGKIKLYLKGEQQVKRHKVTDVKAELLRYEEARNKILPAQERRLCKYGRKWSGIPAGGAPGAAADR